MTPASWSGLANPDWAGRPADGQRGIALITVLAIAGILALLAYTLAERARTTTALLAAQIATAQAEALADAGVYHAVLAMIRAAATQDRFARQPETYVLELDDGTVRVEIADEDGKLDLNTAPPELFVRLFVAVGSAADEAGAVSAAIVRQREVTAAAQSARDRAGADAASPLPTFATVGALQRVTGMSDSLFLRVRPFVTVYGQGDGLDPRAAHPLAAASLPGVGPELVQRLSVGDEGALDAIEENDQASEYILPSRLEIFGIRAEARRPDAATFVREAVVELTGDPDQPYLILAWSEGEADAILD